MSSQDNLPTEVNKEQNIAAPKQQDPIVQYIAIRSDLKWPKGALIAQSCHASLAAVHLNYLDPETVAYLNNLESMHKIVVGVLSQSDLVALGEALAADELKFKLWIEQPENIPTCLATKPYTKSLVEKFFKGFKLFR
jgi:peptidyl-tRNA hydrolase